jgi:hypothetical protein
MTKRPINYTSRDFNKIKADLENYAKRYYPSTFKDFGEASFGAMMLDLVAYVGDQLSFYTDYQANESFLDSAIEYKNVVRLGETLGFKYPSAARSVGTAAFFVLVPANSTTRGPDLNYLPILKRGTLLNSGGGVNFTLNDDVDFTNPDNEVTVARVDTNSGNPTYFAVKAYGQVISGRQYVESITVTDYQRFLSLELGRSNITEILSIKDSEGHEYYEVEYLTQDVVFQEQLNTENSRTAVPYNLRTIPVPRRFVTRFTPQNTTFVQFGYGSSENITGDVIADPADVVLDTTGRKYITDATFDPTNLIKTDKFGVVPTNTVLTVTYVANSNTDVNAPVGAINTAISPEFRFQNQGSLNAALVNSVIASLEVTNESPVVGDTSLLGIEDVRTRALGTFASQNRAVTRGDYINLCYRMPSKFGRVKRVNISQDPNSKKRNLNLYVLSENSTGKLISPNPSIKNNLKTWINRYRMLNDTVDILDGNVINFGINFQILPDMDVNKFQLLQDCVQALKDNYLNVVLNMGEPVYISDIYKILNDVPGVVDTVAVELINKSGGVYSEYEYEITSHLSRDGRYLIIPEDAVAEVYSADQDISGVVI